MNKQQFVLAYVLARAGGTELGLDAVMAAQEGAKAWEFAAQFAPQAQHGWDSIDRFVRKGDE